LRPSSPASAPCLYAAYHFDRTAPYGVIANLLAMPVVSAEVMPMGILGVLAMPFGFDAIFWKLMGYGITWMDTVALWVTSLPGAVGRVRGVRDRTAAARHGGDFAGVPVAHAAALERRRVLALIAGLRAVATPLPDILVSGDGQAAAIRGRDGRLEVLHSNRDSFAIKEWLAADGDARTVNDATLRDGVACDAAGCIGRLSDGRPVSEALSVEAFAEDCARAAVVVSPREAQRDCAAILIDRRVLARQWRFELALDRRSLRAKGCPPTAL
jgi:competence protein ComEC